MLDTAVASGGVMLLTLLTGIILARVLGPEARGQYGAVQFWGQFAGTVITGVLYEALVVRLRARGDDPRSAVPLVLLFAGGVSVFVGVVVWAVSAPGILNVPGVAWQIVAIFVLLIAVSSMVNMAFGAIESAGLAFGRLNIERVLAPALFLAAVLGLFLAGAAGLVSVLVAFVLARLPILAMRIYRFRHHLFGRIDRSLAGEVLRLVPRFFVASGALSVAMQADRVIATTLWPAEWLGYYFVAFSAAGAGLALASQAIGITLLPTLAGLPVAERRDKIERLLRLSFIAALGVTVPVFLLAPVLVPLIYGAAFTPAVHYVQGIVIAMTLLPALQIVNIANRANERGRPGVEMALAMVAVYGGGYLLTGFADPKALFAAMFLANCAAILTGMRHLSASGVLRFGRHIVPGPADLRYLGQKLSGYFGGAARKLGARLGRRAS